MAQILTLDAGHRFRIHKDLIDTHGRLIGPLGMAVYTVLARYAHQATGAGVVSIIQIARALDMTRADAKVGLSRLVDTSLVEMAIPDLLSSDAQGVPYRLLDPSLTAVSARLASRVKQFEYTPPLERG